MRVTTGAIALYVFTGIAAGLLLASFLLAGVHAALARATEAQLSACVASLIEDEVDTQCEAGGEVGYLDCVAWRNRAVHRATLRAVCQQGPTSEEIQI